MTQHIADRIEATKIQTLILHLEKEVFLANVPRSRLP
jgi:hypothetical protein